jgi:tetratricopeptide (TPR) repeat protein
MSIRYWKLLILVALFLWPAAVFGQSPELTDAFNRRKELVAEGRYQEAFPFAEEALRLSEREFGPDHPNTGAMLGYLGRLHHAQGRYAEAGPLYKRQLTIWQNTIGPEHPNIAKTLNDLADLYRLQGRYTEAEPLYGRALEIWEKALGPEHPDVALGLNNLALLYYGQGRYAEAEPLYKRALEILEKVLGPDHPDVARGLNNLANLYHVQGHYDEAEPLLNRALETREKVLGPDHPEVAQSLHNLAALYRDQSRYTEAEPFYKRALVIWEKAFGPDHPNVAKSLGNLVALYNDQGRLTEALDHIRRATAIHRTRAKAGAGKSASGALSEQKKERPYFALHLDIAYQVAAGDPPQEPALHGEAFEVSQLARATAAASAVAQLGARFAAGEDRLAQLVREHQDTLGLWQTLDAALIEEVSKPPDERNAEVEKSLRAELADADKRMTEGAGRRSSSYQCSDTCMATSQNQSQLSQDTSSWRSSLGSRESRG